MSKPEVVLLLHYDTMPHPGRNITWRVPPRCSDPAAILDDRLDSVRQNMSYTVVNYEFPRGLDTRAMVLQSFSHLDERSRSGLAPGVLTHFERAEYFLRAIATPIQKELLAQWIADSPSLCKLKCNFESDLEKRYAAVHTYYYNANSVQLPLEVGACAVTTAPGCGVLPNEFWLVVRSTMPTNAARERQSEIGPGVYLCTLCKAQFSYSSISFSECWFTARPNSATGFDSIIHQNAVLSACKRGLALVPVIACGGLPTHIVGRPPSAGLPVSENVAQDEEMCLDTPLEGHIDRLDSSFLSRLGVDGPLQYLWLSWMYHPRVGILPDRSRNQIIRSLVPLAS